MASFKRPQETQIVRGRDITVTADARAYPILITTTAGELDIESYDRFFEWRTQWTDFAAANNDKIVLLMLNESLKPPSAVVRKHIADKVKNDGQIDSLLAVYMVVESAVWRGIVTAVMWIAGSSDKVRSIGSLRDAVHAAERALTDEGFTPPKLDPDTYVLPT